MLVDIFFSLIILPTLLQQNYPFEEFLDLATQNSAVDYRQLAPQRIYSDVIDVQTTAHNVLAVDLGSGRVLYDRNSSEVVPIASITKLMTALVFLDYNPGWQTEFTTVASDRKNGGIIHLNTGDTLTIKNLFYTALVPSDNDAASALARATGLSPSQFVEKMNAKAEQLGLSSAKFSEPTGLSINNQASLIDIVKLLDFALKNQHIAEATGKAYYEFEVRNENIPRKLKLYNTNLLLNSYMNIIGGKTGHLDEAGYCLAVKVIGDNKQEIMIVVMGSKSNADRFQDVKAISDWIFTNYQWAD